MNYCDAIGYVASTLVLTAFGMKSMIPLRLVAMCSNVVFIIYGLGLELTPVWSLHAALLPMNAWRLVEALGARKLVGPQVLRQAADDDEPVVGSSMIPWLSSRLAPKIESFSSLPLNALARIRHEGTDAGGTCQISLHPRPRAPARPFGFRTISFLNQGA